MIENNGKEIPNLKRYLTLHQKCISKKIDIGKYLQSLDTEIFQKSKKPKQASLIVKKEFAKYETLQSQIDTEH